MSINCLRLQVLAIKKMMKVLKKYERDKQIAKEELTREQDYYE
jgi:hypothetical protein